MASYELEHLEEDDSGITVAGLTGELDLTNVNELAQRLDEIAGLETPLVLDLNRVVFIDSAALHCLFRIARDRGRNGLALVVDPESPIAATLAIVELGRAATIAPTAEAARAAVAPSPR
jgi:anti-anti-sigma factor